MVETPARTPTLVAAVAVAAVAAVAAAGAAGTGPLAGTVPPAPAADDGNVNLSAAEASVVEHFNQHRNVRYLSGFDRRESLDRVAAFITRTRAVEGTWPAGEALADAPPAECQYDHSHGAFGLGDDPGLERYAAASSLARDVALSWVRSPAVDLRNSSYTAVGIDIRAGADGAVFVSVVLC